MSAHDKIHTDNELDAAMNKRDFLKFTSCFAASAVLPAAAHENSDEHYFWSAKAGLLDPKLYEYHYGQIDITVPPAETWYVLSAWWIYVNDSPIRFFQRALDASQRTLALAAGTRLRTVGDQPGYIYICRPAMASYSDPKEIFFKRIRQLSTLPVETIGLEIPAGSPQLYIPEVSFPEDFESGMVTSVSSHDIAWSGLKSPPNGGLNTENEISDDHEMRFAGPALIPFQRSVFPIFYARSASQLGIARNFSSLYGTAALTYLKLPNEW